MARRSKDPNQSTLFDFAPVKKPKVQLSELKFTPMKKEIVMMLVHYKDGVDVSHTSVPESRLDDSLKYYKSCEAKGHEHQWKVMGWDDYWEKWHAGEFVTGRV